MARTPRSIFTYLFIWNCDPLGTKYKVWHEKELLSSHVNINNKLMNFTTIRTKIVPFSLRVFACVLSLLRAESVRRGWPAVIQLYMAQAGEFQWGFYGFGGGNGRGLAVETKVCESCRKQWPSATLCWHCSSACGLPAKQEESEGCQAQNLSLYIYVSVYGGWNAWRSWETINPPLPHPLNGRMFICF